MGLLESNTFKECVITAYDKKLSYEQQMVNVCDVLRNESPYSYNWFYNNHGFFQVDVPLEYLDDYLVFVESLVGCKYTTMDNLSGVSILVNLSTLQEELK